MRSKIPWRIPEGAGPQRPHIERNRAEVLTCAELSKSRIHEVPSYPVLSGERRISAGVCHIGRVRQHQAVRKPVQKAEKSNGWWGAGTPVVDGVGHPRDVVGADRLGREGLGKINKAGRDHLQVGTGAHCETRSVGYHGRTDSETAGANGPDKHAHAAAAVRVDGSPAQRHRLRIARPRLHRAAAGVFHIGRIGQGQAVREIEIAEFHRPDPEVVAHIVEPDVQTQQRTCLNTTVSIGSYMTLRHKAYDDEDLVGRLGRPGHQGEARQQAGPGKEPGQKPHGDAHAPRAATRNRGGVRRFRGGGVR